MIGLNTRSVRFRTTAGATLALAVLLATAGFVVNWLVGREIQQAFDATLLEQASDRAAQLGAGAPPQSLMTVTGHEVIVVAVSPAGDVLASAGTPAPEEVVGLAPGVFDASLTVVEEGESDEPSHAEDLRVAVAEAGDGSVVVVGNEGESAKATKARVRSILLVMVPAVAAVGAAVAWTVTGRALRPVKKMRADLDDVVHAGDGRRVEEPGSEDEIAVLADSINDVLDRLDAQSAVRRQFVADASHELKSPLANARVLVDTSSAGLQSQQAGEPERIRTALLVELDRLQALVDDLLYLARTDETAPPVPGVFDLDDLVFDEAERVSSRTTKTIDGSGIQPGRVRSDRNEVARAVRNLIENAERFAATTVTVSLDPGPGMTTVEIADDGPGIPPGDHERIFERFARVDSDRGRADGGTGLGLAIVASVAARNGGDIRLVSPPGGGARFVLSLPSVAD